MKPVRILLFRSVTLKRKRVDGEPVVTQTWPRLSTLSTTLEYSLTWRLETSPLLPKPGLGTARVHKPDLGEAKPLPMRRADGSATAVMRHQ